MGACPIGISKSTSVYSPKLTTNLSRKTMYIHTIEYPNKVIEILPTDPNLTMENSYSRLAYDMRACDSPMYVNCTLRIEYQRHNGEKVPVASFKRTRYGQWLGNFYSF